MVWDPTLLLESLASFITSLVDFIIEIINLFYFN